MHSIRNVITKCAYHSEHNTKHSSHDGFRDDDEDGTKFVDNTLDQHQ